jgi:uncharacterized protein (DUF4415 family)
MATSRKLTPQQEKDLARLHAMRDKDIDFSDIPEVTDWSGFHRPEFYRPVKQPVTLRLDAGVLAWFKARASAEEGYQTAINRVLRDYVAEHGRSA